MQDGQKTSAFSMSVSTSIVMGALTFQRSGGRGEDVTENQQRGEEKSLDSQAGIMELRPHADPRSK
jgi:hypothetical protein